MSIKSLYVLALAEGEGVGTAYEYYVKRRLLDWWFRTIPRPGRILVAGLPEKYGASLDFLYLSSELGASVTVVDDRPIALERLARAAEALKDWMPLKRLDWDAKVVGDISEISEVEGRFELGFSSEVLQRLEPEARIRYVTRFTELAPHVALFAPNAENPSHTELSGLSGLGIASLLKLAGNLPLHAGHIDMPPFPPGMVRSAAQREKASTGWSEALAMWGLAYYARLEDFFPRVLRRRRSHIVYALISQARS